MATFIEHEAIDRVIFMRHVLLVKQFLSWEHVSRVCFEIKPYFLGQHNVILKVRQFCEFLINYNFYRVHKCETGYEYIASQRQIIYEQNLLPITFARLGWASAKVSSIMKNEQNPPQPVRSSPAPIGGGCKNRPPLKLY